MEQENKKTLKAIYNSEEPKEWGGNLNEFLWICAGVDRKVLRQCPTDYAKYAGIGGTILFTALMAMLSGGYALFSVFKEVWVAMAFGVFWGLLIFNLDRFIVNTMYSDGKVTISWREFYCGLPRIIMAIFLGVVISTPLELKIYENEINVTIDELKTDYLKKHTATDQFSLDSLSRRRAHLVAAPVDPLFQGTLASTSTEAMNLSNQINSLISQKDEYQTQLNNVKTQISKLSSQRNKFEAGSNNYKRIQGQITPLTNKRGLLNNKISDLNKQINELRSLLRTKSASYDEAMKAAEKQRMADIQLITSEMKELSEKIKNASTTYKDVISKNFNGFQAKMLAFDKMKKEDESTRISSWFIMLLFIIVETAPTFFKMMIALGPYDDLLRAEMHKVKVLSDKRISDINDDINTEIQISTEKNKNRLEAEVKANQEVLNRIALAQVELLQVAIDAWREEELVKIQANPSNYIRTNMSEQEAASSAYIRSNTPDDMGNKPENRPDKAEEA